MELHVQNNTFQLSILKGNFPVAIYLIKTDPD